MKFSNKYIAIDIETTDTDSAKGDIIQIGAVSINEECAIIGDFSTYIKPMSEHRNQKAMAVNEISEAMLFDAPRLDHVLTMFEDWSFQIGPRPILAAWGSYFDIPFLEAMYARIGRRYPFSYKNLDLKTIAIWEAAKSDVDISALPKGSGVVGFLDMLGLEFQGYQHDALDDIKNTMRIIQTLI